MERHPSRSSIGQHIANELGGRHYGDMSCQPDLVVPDTAGRVSMDPAGVDNVGYSEEPPEHYDIDNASSIAPSDLVDVVGHYRRYRSGKLPVSQGHRHRHPRHTPSPTIVLAGQPNAQHSTPLGKQGLNPLSRASPLHPQLRQSPAPNIPSNMRPVASVRSTPLSGISELYPDSSATYSDGPSLSNGHIRQPRQNPQQPISELGLRSTPVGLTVEEVERLNNRKLSPSTMDAQSTSSDDPSRNNINRTDFTHADLLDPSSMLPPESSSDDSTNDSFTCSEFEYDHEKIRNDVNSGRMFPRLARVPEAEDTDFSRNEVSDREGSISTFFTSDDEFSRSGKVPNTALNWDYLLNWGPNFEKLVGVFNDIAQLPDVESQYKPSQYKPSLPPKPKSPKQPTPPKHSRGNTPQSQTSGQSLPHSQSSRQSTPVRLSTPHSPAPPQSPISHASSAQPTSLNHASASPSSWQCSPVPRSPLSWQQQGHPVAASPLVHVSRGSTPHSHVSRSPMLSSPAIGEVLNASIKEEYV